MLEASWGCGTFTVLCSPVNLVAASMQTAGRIFACRDFQPSLQIADSPGKAREAHADGYVNSHRFASVQLFLLDAQKLNCRNNCAGMLTLQLEVSLPD